MPKLKDTNKKIEEKVVKGYKKVEETVEEAKTRLKKEQEEIENKNEE